MKKHLTEFEINRRVAIIEGYDVPKPNPIKAGQTEVRAREDSPSGYNYHYFDYCNHWHDGGPIIEKYGISLTSVGDGVWNADQVTEIIEESEDRFETFHCESSANAQDDKPLRAVMLCLLEMELGDKL